MELVVEGSDGFKVFKPFVVVRKELRSRGIAPLSGSLNFVPLELFVVVDRKFEVEGSEFTDDNKYGSLTSPISL